MTVTSLSDVTKRKHMAVTGSDGEAISVTICQQQETVGNLTSSSESLKVMILRVFLEAAAAVGSAMRQISKFERSGMLERCNEESEPVGCQQQTHSVSPRNQAIGFEKLVQPLNSLFLL